MSPGADSEGFDARQNGHVGGDMEYVTIVGAGPAGLMLG
jgi:NADPH-dependent 2,4-dienoyl-CoA reductase/sulfur reductase-like enzyme